MRKMAIVASILITLGYAGLKEDIVGKWQNEKAKMEFFSDGTVLINKANGASISGDYTVLGEDRLKMTLSAMGIKMMRVAKVKLENGKLELKAEDTNKVTIYKRAK